MEIVVVHMKDFGKKSHFIDKQKGALYIYCGRPSRLANPFYMTNESEREEVISRFRQNLPVGDIESLNRYCVARRVKRLYLGCFCAPKACHCDVIKEVLKTTRR